LVADKKNFSIEFGNSCRNTLLRRLSFLKTFLVVYVVQTFALFNSFELAFKISRAEVLMTNFIVENNLPIAVAYKCGPLLRNLCFRTTELLNNISVQKMKINILHCEWCTSTKLLWSPRVVGVNDISDIKTSFTMIAIDYHKKRLHLCVIYCGNLFNDARTVSLYPHNRSQIMQYVKYTK